MPDYWRHTAATRKAKELEGISDTEIAHVIGVPAEEMDNPGRRARLLEEHWPKVGELIALHQSANEQIRRSQADISESDADDLRRAHAARHRVEGFSPRDPSSGTVPSGDPNDIPPTAAAALAAQQKLRDDYAKNQRAAEALLKERGYAEAN